MLLKDLFLPKYSIKLIKLKQLDFLRTFLNGLVFPILQKIEVVSQPVITWYSNIFQLTVFPKYLHIVPKLAKLFVSFFSTNSFNIPTWNSIRKSVSLAKSAIFPLNFDCRKTVSILHVCSQSLIIIGAQLYFNLYFLRKFTNKWI